MPDQTEEKSKKIKVAAIGDIHVKEHMLAPYRELFSEISEKADVLVLCGDLCDLGLPGEAEILSEDLRYCRIPVVGVLGNHDFQSDQTQEIKRILQMNKNVTILDQEPAEHFGVGFAGVKGFIGGFGRYTLGAFGEPTIKAIVSERDREANLLENQLKALNTDRKVVLMHYSPIYETVSKEPAEIAPFLGATRFAQVIDQYEVTVAFHGHANMGPHMGKTLWGTPVYNVAYPLMQNVKPKEPYALIEV